jgi:tetratricopeptide (TPR) repeat protein
LLYSLGKYNEAIEYYDKSLAIERNDAAVLNHKGIALADSGKYSEAIIYFDKGFSHKT